MEGAHHHLEGFFMHRSGVLIVLMVAGLMVACTKKKETAATASTPSATAPAPAPTTAPAPAPAAAPAKSDEAAAKRKAVEFALREDGYKSDPLGQWATDAKASSTYASDLNNATAGYHPMRATGAPDVQRYGDTAEAWASKTADSGIEWLELGYAKPVSATELRIRQNHAPGAIIKVELFEANGTAHTVFQGPDGAVYEPNAISWLIIKTDKTPYKTQRTKITLATNAVAGWNEIDAVQLVGE
jgi:hypothetical protein